MLEPPSKISPQIPAQSRGVILALTPLILAFGVWTMIKARIGRDPMPIEGPLAIALGAVMAGFAVALFVIAWRSRGQAKP